MTEERAESRTGTKTGVRLRKLLTGQKRYPVVFAGLILLYLILLFVVSCIPNEWLSGNYEESMKEFTKGMYWSVDDSLVGTQMDGGTDQLILSNCVTDESHSAFYNMLDVKDYARYWHGYLVPVRPLLCLMTYKHIKYISMILCFVLLCLVYEKVGKAINRGVGMALIVSLCMGNIIVIPLSFQYMSMYYITTVAVLLYCLAAKRGRPDAGLFFLAVGSVTNFIDFLTSPLNSLGMLLVVAYLLYVKQAPEERGLKRILFLLKNSVAWVCGYGLYRLRFSPQKRDSGRSGYDPVSDSRKRGVPDGPAGHDPGEPGLYAAQRGGCSAWRAGDLLGGGPAVCVGAGQKAAGDAEVSGGE